MAAPKLTAAPLDQQRRKLALQPVWELDQLLGLAHKRLTAEVDDLAVRGLVIRSEQLSSAIMSLLDDEIADIGDLHYLVRRETMAANHG